MSQSIANDVLRGAEAIAAYLGLERRAVYHAAASGQLPVFHIGSIVHARKSTLTEWIASQERAAGSNDNHPAQREGVAA